MARPLKATELAKERILKVAQMRHNIPSDKQLAEETGLSTRTIQRMMRRLWRRLDVSSGEKT
jgi:uncharacterized protein YerC